MASEGDPCPICLKPVSGEAFLDPCFHRFCYHCILQWAEMVSAHPSAEGETALECPLCRSRSSCILHGFFLETFQRHYLFDAPPSKTHLFNLSPAHCQRLYAYKSGLQESVAKALKRQINSRRKKVLFVSQNSNAREWIQRELQALMQVEDVDLITQHVLGTLRCSLKSQKSVPNLWIDAMHDAVKPFLFEHANAFCSELQMFLCSGLNVKAYDLLVEDTFKESTLESVTT